MARENSCDVGTYGGRPSGLLERSLYGKEYAESRSCDKWFTELQKEAGEASETALQDFQAAIVPDAMGPDGKEGIDDAD